MMQYTLKNDKLSATILAKGAELCKLVDNDGINYLWSADPTVWPRHAPILFPLVGRIVEGNYHTEGQIYQMAQHGFARDMTFTLTQQTDVSLTFSLVSNETTLSLYPFKFQLDVIYVLNGCSLEISYHVHNLDTKTITFKLGAHPGFMCPLFKDEKMEDYYLEFEKPEKALLMSLSSEGLLSHETETFIGQTIPLSPEIFKKDALIFTNLNSKSISLCSHNHSKKVSVVFDGFPFLGIWSTATPSPFVCIEPWFGHTDFTDDSKDFGDKKDIVSLLVGKTFTCKHILLLN